MLKNVLRQGLGTFGIVLLAGSLIAGYAQTNTTTTTTTTTTTKKPAPAATTAKPAAPAAKPAPIAATPVATVPAKAAPAAPAQPIPAATNVRTAPVAGATHAPAAASTSAAGNAVQPAVSRSPIAPGGKGAAIGTAATGGRTPLGTGATTATPGATRSALPLGGTTAAPGAAVAPNTRSAIPVGGTANPAATSGRAPIMTGGSGDPRAPVAAAGLGTFLYGDWTLNAYGCYRSGTRLLCDFDTSKQTASQGNANYLWQHVNLVDNGGKLIRRHNAFFLGEDGSQFDTGYGSQNPVRMVMEFDDVPPSVTTVSLVANSDKIENIQVVDASQQGAASAQAPAAGQPVQAGAPAAAGAQAGATMDKAQQGVNNATNTVNDKKAKAKGIWDSIKSAAQTTKQ